MVRLLGLLVLVAAVVNVVNGRGQCPPRCLCFRTTVRCMFLQLERVPTVPTETTILDLRFNKIRDIPANSFKDLKNLNTLLLNNNHLTKLKNGVFNGLRELRYLYLYKNRIREIESKVFQGLGKLEQLYLHFNSLEEFLPETFSNLPSVERLFLHNNKLRRIPSGAFKNMESLRRLRLDSNALVCDCEMMWLAHMLKEKQGATQAAATCQAPASLQGRPLAALDDNEFHCRKPQITEEPRDVEVSFGGTVYFTCKAEGDPMPDIYWLRNSNEINMVQETRYSMLKDGTLMIEDAQDVDAGVYECMAKSPVGEARSRSAKMNYHSSKAKPRFILTPGDRDIVVGEQLQLECEAKGQPHPDIAWTKDDLPIASTARHKINKSGTLLISQVQISDGGIYRCSAANYLGRVTALAQIRVLSLPKFLERPQEQRVREDESADFHCEAEGNPPPLLTWSKDGHTMTADVRVSISSSGSHLRLHHVRREDAGLYRCEARNTLGFAESSAELMIQEKLPPRFLERPGELEATVGSRVEMRCRADGFPVPRITWRRDGRTLEDSDNRRIAPDGSLLFLRINRGDEGLYECSAQNEYGYSTARGYITLRDETSSGPGDRFVDAALEEARQAVDRALNETVRALYQRDRQKADPSPSDLLRLVRFPNEVGREVARAAEIYERTLQIVRQHVEEGMHFNLSGFSYQELLSPTQLQQVANVSGCLVHRTHNNCSDICFHSKYRSMDGTCNNLQHPMWGASLTGFKRLLHPIYENGLNTPVAWNPSRLYNGFQKPSARLVSTQLITTDVVSPDEHCTHMLMQWGQFLDHDLDHAIPSISKQTFDTGVECSRTCDSSAPCFPIPIPANDPRIRSHRCMEFTRSSAICGSGFTSVFFQTVQPREQINQLTAFIDSSQVYGSSDEEARVLRDFTTPYGLLREGPNSHPGKPLMPFSEGHPVDCRRDPRESAIGCFLAGDIRSNEQVGLLAMHTVWFREHNRLARELRLANPIWDGDTLYYEARKIVGAEMQHITYAHWLPHILGAEGMRLLGEYKGYNPKVDPGVANVFATAVLRFGHTLINPVLPRLNGSFQSIPEGDLPLHQAFFSPWRLVDEGGVDPLLRGLFALPAKVKRPDQFLNAELTERLFKMAHVVALDLAAINIQRGRDHALPGYNDWRRFCNLTEVHTFHDLRNEIRSQEVRDQLQQLYGHPSNIDVWVGGIAEDVEEGARVGPLFRCLLVDQFKRLRDGDRFWYENPGVYKPEQLTQIKQSSLSRVLCDNGDDIREISHDVFVLPQQLSPAFVSCEEIPKMDLRLWTECCQECRRNDFHTRLSVNRVRRSTEHSYPEDLWSLNNLEPDNSSLGTDTTSGRHIHGGLRVPISLRVNHNKVTESNHVEREFLLDDLNDERIEGIENVLEKFERAIKQLRRKVRRLEKHCGLPVTENGPLLGRDKRLSAPRNCIFRGELRKHGDAWDRDKCVQCVCQNGQVICSHVSCPQVMCDDPQLSEDGCCPQC